MVKNIQLDIYEGKEATVNAYIFSDNESIVLVDCLRNSHEASLLAERIKKQNKPLTHILITHGHPDHYLGLNILKQEFPDSRVVVASQEIKADIINFSTWMESVGWLDKEPTMKPKTAHNERGFDYENIIEVLSQDTLSLAEGATLQLNTNYPAAECEHLTTIFSEDLNAFFTSDFCYHGVHMWLAIDPQHISNWKAQLDKFKHELAAQNPKVYPGHGKPADVSLFDEVKKYIEDFEAVIAKSTTRAEAMEAMVKFIS